MKKVLIILVATVFCSIIIGKGASKNDLVGTFWIAIENNNEEGTKPTDYYYMYTHKYLYTLQPTNFDTMGIRMYRYFYGFYDNDDLPSLDSLKQSGDVYFEVNISDFKKGENGEQIYTGNSLGLSVVNNKQDTIMIIEWSTRQMFFTYKKINKLPDTFQVFLQKKGIHVGFPHKEIAVTKSIIYSEPNKPTKMYLIKGDIVTVLEEKDGWIKMEYEGKKMITGWIKKKDTKK
jgi:hypothetical protein